MTDNPRFRRQQKAGKIGVTGRKSESRLAKRLGGSTRPASGAIDKFKGDIDLGDVLVEAKSTIRDSLSLKYDWLHKIATEARAEGKTPALSVSFTLPDATPAPHGEWVLIPLSQWRALCR